MRAAVATLTGGFVAVALGIALAIALGGVSPFVAATSLFLGTVLGALAFVQCPSEPGPRRKLHPVEWIVLGVFVLASLRAFLWLTFTKEDQLAVLSPNNLGDMPLHLGFIRYFASGVPFWPESPIFTGHPLTYPIGSDFFNSLLLALGMPVEQGLIWVGLAGCALTLVALWRWGGSFTVAAFLFGGGLAGFVLLRQLATGQMPAIEDFQNREAWKNPFLALFVTQRGFLFALPAGLLILDHWRAVFLRGGRGILPPWVALLFYATLPLYSVHSFLYLSIALAGIFVFAPDATARRRCLAHVALAFLPAAICAALVTDFFSASGGIHFQPGWMQGDAPDGQEPPHPVWFWVKNFGLYGLLWLLLTGLAIVRGDRETRAVVLPATLLFGLCAFVSFAVWPWDNTKILIWCWLAVAPCLWREIILPMPVAGRTAICFVLFFTGVVSLAGGLDARHGYTIVKLPHVRAAEAAVAGLPRDARFAIAPEFSHPLLILGRKLALGYDGHLWSHGLNYRPKMDDLDNLMLAGPGWQESAKRLDVDYLFWSNAERQRYTLSQKWWTSETPVAARADKVAIYSLKGAK